jgi:hypothetical protein
VESVVDGKLTTWRRVAHRNLTREESPVASHYYFTGAIRRFIKEGMKSGQPRMRGYRMRYAYVGEGQDLLAYCELPRFSVRANVSVFEVPGAAERSGDDLELAGSRASNDARGQALVDAVQAFVDGKEADLSVLV